MCVICGKYRKFGKPKISHLLEKHIICSIWKSKEEKIFLGE